ncbi:MAG: hypothetical protein J3K34DRAFT_399205 [Monoraphidium minutum]|nr:MAG: hypothetical protein J3K34DRAFT_399205 [Monoraphidium minutum]
MAPSWRRERSCGAGHLCAGVGRGAWGPRLLRATLLGGAVLFPGQLPLPLAALLAALAAARAPAAGVGAGRRQRPVRGRAGPRGHGAGRGAAGHKLEPQPGRRQRRLSGADRNVHGAAVVQIPVLLAHGGAAARARHASSSHARATLAAVSMKQHL